ncbi:MAG: HEAT repeat domain-containing protein, partial [Planctomycetota bacterium]
MRALLVLFCLVLPVLARGGKRDDPIFELPEGKKAPEKAEKEQIREDLAKDIERLAGWPGERSRRAAERLIVQKEHSLPVIRKILVSTADSDENYKPGAGYVLGRIGEASDFLTLVLVASEKRQHKHAATLLEAAWRLNPDQAVAEAFRFFHLSATTLRREATKFVRARITKKNLTAVVELLDKRTAERPFTREIGLILLDRLVETREITWSEAGPRIYRALGDESPQVASRAMRLVASHNEAANIKELNQLITKEYSYWRQRSYAALGLALLSSAFKVQPFTPETIESLKGERGLEHPRELLAQASAALALAQAGLRTGDRELVRLLDSKIPIVLIESVGASRRHYRDFASVMPLSYAMLRRITGQNFPDQAPVWAQWWRDHGRRFRARRELIEVDEDDLEAAVLEVTWPQSTPRKRSVRLQMVGIQQPSYLHGRAYAVPKEEIARLTGLLRESGFFQAMEVDPARLDREEAMVVLRVGDLVRTVAYGKGEGLTQVRDRILNAVDATTKEYSWQLWWSIREQPSWQLFFGENRRWFKDHPGAEERAARMRSMVAGAVGGMTMVDDRLFAVRFLRDLPGGGGALTEDEVAKLVAAVAGEREANRFVAEVLELLVPEAGPKAASGLVDALAAKVGPRSQDLLVELCSSIPFEKVAALASDSRWKVRRSAVAALAKKDAERARPVLEQRLEDEEVFVRVVAAEALARVQDPATLPALAILSKDDSENVRASAAYAYGLMGSAASRKAIRPLLYNDTYPDVRVRAIEGLAESRDPAAVDLLIGVFERETDVR